MNSAKQVSSARQVRSARHLLKPALALFFSAAAVSLAWWWILSGVYSGVSVFSKQAWERALDFFKRLAGEGEIEGGAAYTKAAEWRTILDEMVETLQLSLAGAVIAGAGALIFSALLPVSPGSSASPISSGPPDSPKSPRRPHPTSFFRLGTKALFTLTRTIPELIWALLLLLIIGPGSLGVVLALAIHNFGVLGRLFDGTLSANPPPLGGRIAGVGASRTQQFYYGDLNLLSGQFMTLWLNRLEVIIRSTVVLGFVASAGLGLHLRLALSGRRFTEVALVLMAYLILIFLVDLFSVAVRRLIKA